MVAVSLKRPLVAAALLLCGLAAAQSVRTETYRDLTQLERTVNLRGNDFLLMGKDYLWGGLERLLLEKLRLRVKVRVLTGERDAPRFDALARAGAEVRTLPGAISQGPMLAGDLLVSRNAKGEFVAVETEYTAIVRSRTMQMFTSGMTKAYRPR